MNGKTSRPFLALTLTALACVSLSQVWGANISISSNITTSQTWTNDNTYFLTLPIYVTNGATLKIEPGTVIRGEPESVTGANDPGTLIITRGSKILALGTHRAPIVFTNLDDDNIGSDPGTNPYDNATDARSITGTWGGVVLLGRSYVANNTAGGPDPARAVQIEGLTPTGGLGLYGDCQNTGAFPNCDDDDSGALRYVSIRYGGFNLSANNEINGLTLGAVGRTTDIDYVEVFQNKDDGIEFFGGTAQVKHAIVYSPGDDSFDYDEGFRGKIQFGFVVQGTPGTDKSDKGGEQDGGNNPDGSRPFTIPTYYNITWIGLGQKNYTDKAKNTALHYRDNAGGRQYNSFYADFGGAPAMIEGGNLPGGSQTAANSSGERAITAYPGAVDPAFFTGPPSAFQLELQDNCFWCFGAGGILPSGDATASGGDAGKTHYDNGAFSNATLDNQYLACNQPLPIRLLTRETILVPTVPNPVLQIDPRPAPGSGLLVTDRLPPSDGFFWPAPYKGAFDDKNNWAVGWSNMWRLGLFPDKPVVQVAANIAQSTTWTQDNVYVLAQPIYVTNGATLNIEAGTTVRGEPESVTGANDPGTLIISRGSKIQALGTEDKPIVFTNLDDDAIGGAPGTDPYDNATNARSITGTWGGLVLLGRSYVANNTAGGPDPVRQVQIEGLTPTGGLGLYGDCQNTGGFPNCDDDDSGTLRYVSIRYGGFNLSANNEINGLTLGAVGRGTEVEGVEVFQNKDDGIEFFGGTVHVKKAVIYSPGDDSLDYDEGFRGKVQFALVVQGTPGTDKSDKGGEQDGGNNPDGSRPFAIPTYYNVTWVGLGQKNYTDKAKNTALHYRDNAGGRQYNSFYADFGGAPAMIEGGNLPGGSQTAANSSGERAITAYPGAVDPAFFTGPPSDFQLELQDNCFWCFGAGGILPSGDATASGGDVGKTHYDNGAFSNAALDNDYFACNQALPIRELTRDIIAVPTVPNPVATIDPRPTPASSLNSTDRSAPSEDGFFREANYKGGFSSTENWAEGWTNMAGLGVFPDCDPIEHPNVIPNPARQLVWLSKVTLRWLLPLGEDFKSFDLLRTVGSTSLAAADFTLATCLEDNDLDQRAGVPANPNPGDVFFILVRVVNNCGENLGSRSDGTVRSGPVCP